MEATNIYSGFSYIRRSMNISVEGWILIYKCIDINLIYSLSNTEATLRVFVNVTQMLSHYLFNKKMKCFL